MDGKNGLILWTLGGAGVLLLYSAYKNKSPRTVLASTLNVPAADPSPAAGTPTAGGPGLEAGSFNGRESSDGGPVNGPGYSTGTFDGTGTQYLFDSDGVVAGLVPNAYQKSAATYIPGVFNA